MRVGADRQVRAAPRLTQIGPSGTPTTFAVGRALERTGAFLLAVVEVVVGGEPSLDRGSDKCVGQFPADRLIRNAQRSANAMRRIGPAFLVLGLLEIRQDAVPVPARTAALPPEIIVGRVAAHIHHAVDRAGAAQDLAARLVHGAAFELRLWLAFEHPVDARIGEQSAVAHRHMDPEVSVLAAGFKQQNAIAAVLAQARGDGTAGRTGAGDDEVESAGVDRARAIGLHAVGPHDSSPSPPRRSFSTCSRLRVCQRRRRPMGSFSTSG